MCKWKSNYWPNYECPESSLGDDPKGYCILHSGDEKKDVGQFTDKVKERITRGRLTSSGWEIDKIDLRGCYFPRGFDKGYFRGYQFTKPVDLTEATFSQVANFREVTFSQEVDFVGVKFMDEVDFYKVKFLKEAYFNLTKFSGRSNFIGATFSERAGFSQITFSQSANFNLATFSKGASFWETVFLEKASFENATFLKVGSFPKTSFEKEAEFAGAIFKEEANFDQTNFKGKTNFTWAEFWDWTFFFNNSNETSVKLKNLPVGVSFPTYQNEKVRHDTLSERLIFRGVMSLEERDQLLELSQDYSYKSAIKELFERSQGLYLGKPAIFRHTRFLGKEVIFQDVNISRCSFLHSNIDRVDFRYCEFVEKPERFLWFDLGPRKNVLRDELDADSACHSERSEVTPEADSPRRKSRPFANAQGDTLRAERYEPVRRLYLELKRNFEDKKDWNKAGDFHYGEMECRRKMNGWWGRNILSLEALYYWASGYGERPWRALLWWFLSTLLLFPLLYRLSEHDPFSACVWDSVRVATFMKIGIPIEPESWGRIVLTLQYLICPTLLALFALALRRKVKR